MPDVVAGLDPRGGQVVGQAVAARLELGEGAGVVAADQGDPVGDDIGRVLEEVGHVVCHGRQVEHVPTGRSTDA